mmetsp:Transcript_28471/g.83775  ORF Transcript_28471/g.83775 Transcript_28471/m.83775 type:complete len:1007 (+) Transcript_28471:729-3749(+)
MRRGDCQARLRIVRPLEDSDRSLVGGTEGRELNLVDARGIEGISACHLGPHVDLQLEDVLLCGSGRDVFLFERGIGRLGLLHLQILLLDVNVRDLLEGLPVRFRNLGHQGLVVVVGPAKDLPHGLVRAAHPRRHLDLLQEGRRQTIRFGRRRPREELHLEHVVLGQAGGGGGCPFVFLLSRFSPGRFLLHLQAGQILGIVLRRPRVRGLLQGRAVRPHDLLAAGQVVGPLKQLRDYILGGEERRRLDVTFGGGLQIEALRRFDPRPVLHREELGFARGDDHSGLDLLLFLRPLGGGGSVLRRDGCGGQCLLDDALLLHFGRGIVVVPQSEVNVERSRLLLDLGLRLVLHTVLLHPFPEHLRHEFSLRPSDLPPLHKIVGPIEHPLRRVLGPMGRGDSDVHQFFGHLVPEFLGGTPPRLEVQARDVGQELFEAEDGAEFAIRLTYLLHVFGRAVPGFLVPVIHEFVEFGDVQLGVIQQIPLAPLEAGEAAAAILPLGERIGIVRLVVRSEVVPSEDLPEADLFGLSSAAGRTALELLGLTLLLFVVEVVECVLDAASCAFADGELLAPSLLLLPSHPVGELIGACGGGPSVGGALLDGGSPSSPSEETDAAVAEILLLVVFVIVIVFVHEVRVANVVGGIIRQTKTATAILPCLGPRTQPLQYVVGVILHGLGRFQKFLLDTSRRRLYVGAVADDANLALLCLHRPTHILLLPQVLLEGGLSLSAVIPSLGGEGTVQLIGHGRLVPLCGGPFVHNDVVRLTPIVNIDFGRRGGVSGIGGGTFSLLLLLLPLSGQLFFHPLLLVLEVLLVRSLLGRRDGDSSRGGGANVRVCASCHFAPSRRRRRGLGLGHRRPRSRILPFAILLPSGPRPYALQNLIRIDVPVPLHHISHVVIDLRPRPELRIVVAGETRLIPPSRLELLKFYPFLTEFFLLRLRTYPRAAGHGTKFLFLDGAQGFHLGVWGVVVVVLVGDLEGILVVGDSARVRVRVGDRAIVPEEGRLRSRSGRQ